MVYLPGGGHSVGIPPCVAFENRLYDFQNTGKPDPTMNTTLLKTLQTLCPRNSGGSNSANLLQNPRGSSVVHKSYLRANTVSAGTVSLPATLFAAGIDDNILGKNFKAGVATILGLSSGLPPSFLLVPW
ncbi:hypothetical protein Peur_036942 [Populus x canadensis]